MSDGASGGGDIVDVIEVPGDDFVDEFLLEYIKYDRKKIYAKRRLKVGGEKVELEKKETEERIKLVGRRRLMEVNVEVVGDASIGEDMDVSK